MRALTDKQVLFAVEYLVDLNGKLAAIRAGYCKRNAGIISNENLSNPRIIQLITNYEVYHQSQNEHNRVRDTHNILLMETLVLENISKLIDQELNGNFESEIQKHYILSCLLKDLRH